MSTPAADNLELFSQTAFEQLQFLREYAGVLLDPYPAPDVVAHLFNSAQTLAENTRQFGLPLFAEISGKLAHLFHFAQNTTISSEACGTIVEFVYDAVALLESDLLLLSTNGLEADDDIQTFKEKYPFAFQAAPIETVEPAPSVELVEMPSDLNEAEAEHVVESLSVTEGEVQELPIVEPEVPPQLEGSALAEEPLAESEPAPAFSLPEDGEVPAEILEFFVPEAEEHLQAVTECLLQLEANPDAEIIHRLFRAMHTVKGSAAQVGFHRIATVAHRAEDLIGFLRDGALRPSGEIVDICLEVVDAVKKFLYRQWADETTLQKSVASLLGRIARQIPADSAFTSQVVEPPTQKEDPVVGPDTVEEWPVEVEASPTEVFEAPESAPAEPHTGEVGELGAVPTKPVSPPAAPPKELGAASQSKSVRVPLERLDRMMNAVGELVINRTRILGRLGELERLAEVLNFSKGRMIDKVADFQDRYEFNRLNTELMGGGEPRPRPALATSLTLTAQYRDSVQGEFSELEWDRYDDFNILSRSLTEISADLTEVLTQLGGFVRHVDSDIDEFTKLAHRLQDEITEARMVPIGNLYTRLSRTSRDAAKAAGKNVELTLSGAETNLDNGIIQQISDPLIHLVRNSIAHGIEAEQVRVERGKPAQGQIALRAYHRGNQIHIEVEDDGGGIDYERIRSTAVSQQLATPEEASRLTERELLEFLFKPGFSTASRKTELAGRGVGLDVVRANLTALNGEISIDTQKGVGTRFTLKVPLTLVITQALFLRHGTWIFGIPLACVEEIRRLKASDIEEVGGKLLTRVREQVTEVVRLDARLGLEPVEPVNGYFRMIIVNVAGREIGVIVEEVLRKDEIVIKGLGDFLRNIKLFSGATIAPDGSPILLIEVSRLAADTAGEALVHSSTPVSLAAQSSGNETASVEILEEKTILLADDSISVRRFVGRMLEKAGYTVKFASDGLEALEAASQGACDLVITDLEMPRTSGYELMAHLRQNPATRKLPVVVLTSRAGAKHRDKAFKEGASGFLTKPVQEEQLLAEVEKFLGASAVSPPASVSQVE